MINKKHPQLFFCASMIITIFSFDLFGSDETCSQFFLEGPLKVFPGDCTGFVSFGDGKIYYEKENSTLESYNILTKKEIVEFSTKDGQAFLKCSTGTGILFSTKDSRDLWFSDLKENFEKIKIDRSVSTFQFFPEDCRKVIYWKNREGVFLFNLETKLKEKIWNIKTEYEENVNFDICGKKFILQDFQDLLVFNTKDFVFEKKLTLKGRFSRCGPSNTILGIKENMDGFFLFDIINLEKQEVKISSPIVLVVNWQKEKFLFLFENGALGIYQVSKKTLCRIFENKKIADVVFIDENKLVFLLKK